LLSSNFSKPFGSRFRADSLSDRAMRVALITDGLSGIGGGILTYVECLLAELPPRGVELLVIGGQQLESELPVRYVHVPGIDADRAELHADERANLRAAIAEAAPDLCYAHVVLPEVTRIAAELAPTILYAHEYLTVCPGGGRYLERSRRFCDEGPGARCFWRAYTERTTNRRPDRLSNAYARTRAWRTTWPSAARVFVASPFVSDVLVAGGAPADRMRVVSYPVEPLPHVEPARSFDVLYLGRLVSSKGVDVLLRALALIDGSNAVIAGEGPDRERLVALAEELGLTSRVDFVGWVAQEERSRLLAGARVLALPSLWDEPFGIVGVEALGTGLPVVGAEVGGIPSWLTDGRAGLLFPRNDHPALADALRRILDSPAFEAELREHGPVEAARFSLERHLDTLLAEFAAVAG
jgi:glycosyltransferase involved in cell wall biosynthesis